jgi:hypothetical protein
MKVVFALWKKPIDDRKLLYGFNNLKELAESYVLAVEQARKHLGDVHLVADTSGKQFLTETVGIKFDSVETGLLDQIPTLTPYCWLMPQIAAITTHSEDVIYLEGNAFVYGNVIEKFQNESFDVVFQNVEPSSIFKNHYEPQIKKFDSAPYRPAEMEKFADKQAYNTSFIYGKNSSLLKFWAEYAYDYVTNSKNMAFWQQIAEDDVNHNMIYTNWFAANTIVSMGQSVDIKVRTLLEGYDAGTVPYIHTHGESRKAPGVVQQIRSIIAERYPDYVAKLEALNNASVSR